MVNALYREKKRHGWIKFQPLLGFPKAAKLLRHSIGGCKPFSVFNNTINTIGWGIIERVFVLVDDHTGEVTLTPTTTPHAVMLLRNLARNLRSKLPHDVVPYTPAQVLETLSGRKRIAGEQAFADLEKREICAKDFTIASFKKTEKNKPEAVPRVVSPRGPRANAALSRYIKPMEHIVYEAINQLFGAVVVVKGMNARQRAEVVHNAWVAHDDPVAVGLDAKRFDQHITRELLQFTHNIYTACNKDPEFIKMLQWRLRNRGVARCPDGVIKYEIDGTRASGDPDTSKGNIVIMCCVSYLFIKSTGIRMTFVDDGDDCVFFMNRRDLPAMDLAADFYLQFGLRIALDPPKFLLEQVSFCQTSPVMSSSGDYIMVRDPRIVITKDTITTKFLTPAQIGPYKYGIGMGGVSVYGDIPVLGAFYESIARGQTPHPRFELSEEDNRGLYYASRGFAKKRSAPTPESRASFMVAFGFTPNHQIALEELFDSLPVMSRSEPVTFRDAWFPPQLANLHRLDF